MRGYSNEGKEKIKTMNNNSGGGFSHGFLLGVILGGGLVFLLGTNKGKKLLKTITEEGLEGIADFEDFVEDEAEEYEEKSSHNSSEPVVKASPVEKVVSSTRRLFRGIPKKS